MPDTTLNGDETFDTTGTYNDTTYTVSGQATVPVADAAVVVAGGAPVTASFSQIQVTGCAFAESVVGVDLLVTTSSHSADGGSGPDPYDNAEGYIGTRWTTATAEDASVINFPSTSFNGWTTGTGQFEGVDARNNNIPQQIQFRMDISKLFAAWGTRKEWVVKKSVQDAPDNVEWFNFGGKIVVNGSSRSTSVDGENLTNGQEILRLIFEPGATEALSTCRVEIL